MASYEIPAINLTTIVEIFPFEGEGATKKKAIKGKAKAKNSSRVKVAYKSSEEE